MPWKGESDCIVESQTVKRMQANNSLIEYVDFEASHFIDCSFLKSTFEKVNFKKCTFRGCNFSSVSFTQCGFWDSAFDDCKLI